MVCRTGPFAARNAHGAVAETQIAIRGESHAAAVPRGTAARTALVGLLTSESGRPDLLIADFKAIRPAATMVLDRIGPTSHRLGYSGGAVPVFHRSSLFVDRGKNPRPTTNAQRQ